jgi:MFS family permease
VFEALRNRNFRHLWLGSLSAFTGFFTSTIVQSVVAFQLTGQNRAVGFVALGRGLAQLVLAPVGGALADRVSKRAILVTCQSFTALVFLGLAVLQALGKMQVFYLTIGGFLVGLTFAVLGPTRSAYIVELVDADRRGNAVAMNQIALNSSRVVGPALAGLLLDWHACGPTGAFAVMGVLYIGAIASQITLPPSPPRNMEPGSSILGDMLDGVRYVRGDRRLRTIMLLFMATVMFGFPHVTVLPGFVEHRLHLPATTVSWLFGTSAVGGLLASVLAAPLSDSRHALRAYCASAFVFGLSLMLLWTATTLVSAAVCLVLVGVSSGAFTTLNGAVLMRTAEPRYMGRVMSLGMLGFGAFGLMGVPVGMLADALGEGATLGVLGALVCATVCVLGVVLLRIPAPEVQPATPP